MKIQISLNFQLTFHFKFEVSCFHLQGLISFWFDFQLIVDFKLKYYPFLTFHLEDCYNFLQAMKNYFEDFKFLDFSDFQAQKVSTT